MRSIRTGLIQSLVFAIGISCLSYYGYCAKLSKGMPGGFTVETNLKTVRPLVYIYPKGNGDKAEKWGWYFDVWMQPKDFKSGKIPVQSTLLLSIEGGDGWNLDDWQLDSDVFCDGAQEKRQGILLCAEVVNHREDKNVKGESLFLLDNFTKENEVYIIRIFMYPKPGGGSRPKVSAVCYSK